MVNGKQPRAIRKMASRTHKSILNASVSLFYYFLQMILGFWSRKVFYDYLGSEVLGLDTTAYSLLNFLNLAELGIGTSVAYFLYKPIFHDDRLTINEIVSLQGWIYRRIAYCIMVGAAILMCLFPAIFKKSPLPLWYAYATFSVMLIGSMLGYFINYRQILLTADQKDYKVTAATQGVDITFKLFLIVCLPIVRFPFVLYICTTLVGKIFGCFWLNHVLTAEYPWLSTSGYKGKELLRKYPDIFKKTSQVFIHRISGFVTNYVSPIIMYGFASLTAVAYYGNYLVITEKVTSLLGTVFNSTGAGVGNLIASKDGIRIQKVFWELFDSRLCISWICLFCVYFLAEPFICVWLGSEYLLSKELLVLVIVSSAIFMNRSTVDSFISGYGLFKDVWAPIAQMIVTIFGSVSLGYIYSIEGVVAGGIISQSMFIGIWKPYFLFTEGFKIPALEYFRKFFLRCLIIVLCFITLSFSISLLNLKRIDSYSVFFIYGLVVFIETWVIVYGIFYFLTQGVRDFTKRISSILIKKFS